MALADTPGTENDVGVLMRLMRAAASASYHRIHPRPQFLKKKAHKLLLLTRGAESRLSEGNVLSGPVFLYVATGELVRVEDERGIKP